MSTITPTRSRTPQDMRESVRGRQGAHVIEMQRRRLLLAASELVGATGLESASVGNICKRAGVSRRTFYEVFDDRETCFLAALQIAIKRLEQDLLVVYRQQDRWREQVRHALTRLLESFDANPGLARMCVIESLKAHPTILQYRRIVLERLGRIVDQGRRESKTGSEPVLLTAESIVGGVLTVLHTRLLEPEHPLLIELLNPLMSMIVEPYLGTAIAKRERDKPSPTTHQDPAKPATEHALDSDPFKDLPIRFTYRTARVMGAIATQPGASNRQVAQTAGINDQGQASKLLHRLQQCELIANHNEGQAKGEANAWKLTPRGNAIHTAITG